MGLVISFKEKCAHSQQDNAEIPFLCPWKLSNSFFNKRYLKPYAQPSKCPSQSDATALYAQSGRVAHTLRIAKRL